MSKQLICGVFGYGNVGQGVAEILKSNASLIKERSGYEIVIKTIVVRSPEKYQALDLEGATLSTDADAILNDSEISIVIELMGGEYPAFDIIMKALQAGKHVVTANKEVVAKHKDTFFETAAKHNVMIYFEAAIAGAIPIVRTLKVGYSANRFESVAGIFNGTTNFILTKIHEENKPFADALKEAQDLGFAEADPTMDVNGMDAAYKLVILAAVAFKASVDVSDFPCDGIESIELKDVDYAKQLGYTIKLIASATTNDNGECALMVGPTMLANAHSLASVRNEFNAIALQGNAMHDAMLYGKGAGPTPTGSAVLSDVMSIAFDLDANHTELSRRHVDKELKSISLIDVDGTTSSFYMRVTVADEKGVLEKLSTKFANKDISISTIRQDQVSDGQAEVVLVTHDCVASLINQLKEELTATNFVSSVDALYRVGLPKL